MTRRTARRDVAARSRPPALGGGRWSPRSARLPAGRAVRGPAWPPGGRAALPGKSAPSARRLRRAPGEADGCRRRPLGRAGGRREAHRLAQVVLRIPDAAARRPFGSGSLGAYDENQHLGVCLRRVCFISGGPQQFTQSGKLHPRLQQSRATGFVSSIPRAPLAPVF